MYTKESMKIGLIWTVIESLGTKIISLAVGLTLARYIGPESYGLIAMLTIFIAVADVFVNVGFSSALIQKKNRDEKDYTTVFVYSLISAIVLYLILFLCSEYISSFYGEEELKKLLLWVSTVLIFNSMMVIPKTKLNIEMKFKEQATSSFIAVLFSGGIGIYLAISGYGVWALVSQQIAASFINCIVINIYSPWKPTERFSKKSFNDLFQFSSRLIATRLIDTIFKNIYGLLIGKFHSASQLGLYNQANTLSLLPASIISNSVQKVTYPVMCSLQDNKLKLRNTYTRAFDLTIIITIPIMLMLTAISEPLISILLSKEWQMTAQYMSILTIAMSFYPIEHLALNYFQAINKSKLILKLEVIKKTISMAILSLTINIGVKEICIGIVASTVISVLINFSYLKKYTDINVSQHLISVIKVAFFSSISIYIALQISEFINSEIIGTLVVILSGFIIYLGFVYIFLRSSVANINSVVSE